MEELYASDTTIELGTTQVLLHVNDIARYQFENAKTLTMPSALVEQARRELQVPALNVGARVDPKGAWIYSANRAVAVVPKAKHSDDCQWYLLPSQIQGLVTRLPAGKHSLDLQLFHDKHHSSSLRLNNVEIRTGKPATIIVVARNDLLHAKAVLKSDDFEIDHQ